MDVIMPKMGESINEGTIIKWHKKEGDKVNRDEIIFEISTDKVDTEIPSPAEGILSNIKYKEGDTIEVGTVVAEIKENSQSAKKREDENKNKSNESEPIKNNENNGKERAKEETGTSKSHQAGDEVEIVMPKMGESVMEGTIIKWHKKVGEEVKNDETLFEISTDKVDTEVPSPSSGILSEILVKEQETVEVGTILGKISSKTGKDAK
ncbi:MAG: biotin/lipoyl-containing protein, partial [Ignavibacteria bacterium]